MMLGVTWINSQVVFDGLVQGLALSVITVGIILIYRASRIINFAVGNMGVIGATLLSLLVVQYHVPFWVALPVALVTGLVLGAIVDATVIRRLRKSPRVVVLVATIGIAQIAEAIASTTPAPSTGPGRWPGCRCEDRTFRS
jgi:branched-subunit amino acid ABC-type transport system permease component